MLLLYIIFFFLQYSHKDYNLIVKYKNLISYYLWLSFFTLIFFVISIVLLSFIYGTLDYREINYFYIVNYIFYFIFISLSLKLGVPGFHFFKLELYKYLPINNLILFSVFSLVINFFIFFYLYSLFYSMLFNNTLIILIVLFINIIILAINTDKLSIFYFFALSSVNTWAFFLMIFNFNNCYLVRYLAILQKD